MYIRARRFGLLLALLLTMINSSHSFAYEVAPRSGFPVELSGRRIGFGSPTLADLNGDSKPEILVGGVDGTIYAIQHDGRVLWTYNLTNVINTAAQQASLTISSKAIPIRTAPTVADLNRDGHPEVIVVAGDVFDTQTHGGIVVLNAQGQLLPGWPRLLQDVGGGGSDLGRPDGYADGSVSTPAVGDINGDGLPEIVYAGFDQYVYARRIDGSLLPGWPQWVLDTVWSSPALADLDGNGRLDVIIGVDAHYYRDATHATEDGGDLYAFHGDGKLMWRAHQDEIFQSSPAIGDIDGDGRPEIVAGTGTFYSGLGRADGRYITAWNHDGSRLWKTALPDRAPGSPALGDLTGDGKLEVAIGTIDGRVHALQGSTGKVLWSTRILGIFGDKYGIPPVYSPVLGDYDGNGTDDVFIATGWEVGVLNGGTGQQFTANGSDNSTKPSYYTSYSILGAPAIGDIDKDGKLDLVVASGRTNEDRGRVYSWRLPGSSTKASWPMLHRDPAHHGSMYKTVAVGAATTPQVYIPFAKR